MYTYRHSAAYIIEDLYKEICGQFGHRANELFNSLSQFDLLSFIPLEHANPIANSILAVANNIITRGLPTRLSYRSENFFFDKYPYLDKIEELGGVFFKLNNNLEHSDIWRALHIIDSRTTVKELTFYKSESNLEKKFIYDELPIVLNDYIPQFIEQQRSLNSILNNQDNAKNFYDQRVDFSFEFPYMIFYNDHHYKGIVIEIDGPHHRKKEQVILDDQRNQYLTQNDWLVFRISEGHWQNIKWILQPFININSEVELFEILSDNINKNLDGDWLDILEFTLSPLGIARIHKTLIELLLCGILNLDSEKWNICIIERDIPCAWLSIVDFIELLNNLFMLEGNGNLLPEINLEIYSSSEYLNTIINRNSPYTIKHINQLDQTENYDVILDVSVLNRSNYLPPSNFMGRENYFIIRSSFRNDIKRKIYFAPLIKYPEFSIPTREGNFNNNLETERVLENLLINIFRKKKFKVGQLPILSRILSRQNVVGILPTGGGKSLTYQLASLLQPGVSIVIEPIKSLMKDQVDALKRNLINNNSFINSSFSTGERKIILKDLNCEKILLMLVSPERFLIREFRNILISLSRRHISFAHFIIDEAHCVSEWGHDFRTSYLFLAQNALKYCHNNLEPIKFVCLTATASFDVQTDILREISTKEEELSSDALIRFEPTNRPEIQYEVITIDVDPNDVIGGNRKFIGDRKIEMINDLISNQIPDRFNYYLHLDDYNVIFNQAFIADNNIIGEDDLQQEYEKIQLTNYNSADFYNPSCDNSGIIFCPHRSWVLGVTDRYINPQRNLGIYDRIENNNIIKGTYIGVNSDSEELNNLIENDNNTFHEKFLKNELHLMVCTKAFGMGIDKPNIRYSIHVNYPQSIEGFIQESGRIGRDGKIALSYCLLTRNVLNTDDDIIDYSINSDFYNSSFPGVETEKQILWNLLLNFEIQNNDLVSLNNWIEDNYNDFYVNYWHRENLHRLYLNNRGTHDAYGFIDLVNNTSNFQGVHENNMPMAEELHRAIFNYLENEHIDLIHPNHPQTGILNNINYDNPVNVYLQFNHENRQDIEKGIYRLYILGIVRDVEINYNANVITIEAMKLSDEDLIFNLKKYLLSYYSLERVENSLLNIENIDVDNENEIIAENKFLFKCVLFLIIFIYDEIAKKRKQAIDDMKAAIQYRLQTTNADFKDYIYYYFNAKYAREGYEEEFEGEDVNQSLYDRITRGVLDNIETVIEFIGYAADSLTNFRHLRGACIRLLQLYPDSLSLRLLKAYATLVLEQHVPFLLREGITDFIDGAKKYYDTLNYDNLTFINFTIFYKNKIIQNTTGEITNDFLNSVRTIQLYAHNKWLKKTINQLEVLDGR